MKRMKIEVTIKQAKNVEIEIELPIYRRHIVGDYSTIYTRINEDLSAIHIHKNEKPWDSEDYGYEIEFEDKYEFDSSSLDYHLGKEEYELSKERFNEVMRELKAKVAEL